MNLRLSEAETDALRLKAAEEGCSMQEVAKSAIAEYASDRPGRLLAAIERVRVKDAELLDRLSPVSGESTFDHLSAETFLPSLRG
jgi:hypothetical protein